jgi:ribosomal protein S18 acetylase RimI-like enzyme
MPPFRSAFLPNPVPSTSEVERSQALTTAPPNPAVNLAPPTSPAHVHALRRINALFLPIAYPEKFYTDLLPEARPGKIDSGHEESVENDGVFPADPTALAFLAFWSPPSIVPEEGATRTPAPDGKVIGGIRCRLELDPGPVTGLPQSWTSTTPSKRLYISTVSLLSPYRGLGVATGLVEKATREGIRREGIRLVYAHVWQGNESVLDWYEKRGFFKGEMVQHYYRRLKPDGAWIVWKNVGISESIDGFP